MRQPVSNLNSQRNPGNAIMNRIVWLVGAVVIVLFILGYFGLR